MDEKDKVILEALRMLLWENFRKYDLLRVKHHPNISSVELDEIKELVTKINLILEPKDESKALNDEIGELVGNEGESK